MTSATRRRPTLYSQTLLALFLAVTLLVAVAGVLEAAFLDDLVTMQLSRSMVSLARVMALDMEVLVQGSPEDVKVLEARASSLAARGGCRVTVLTMDGRVLADSQRNVAELAAMESHRERPEVQEALTQGSGTALRSSSTVGYPMLYVAVPLAKRSGVLRVSVPVTVVADIRERTRRAVLTALLVALPIALGLGAWMARRVSHPITRLTEAARRGEGADFSLSPGEAGSWEVRELGTALATMSASVRQHIEGLTSERNRATAILESMAEGVLAIDGQGRVLDNNQAVRHLLGVEEASLAGRSLFEVMPYPEIQEMVAALLASSQRRILDIHGLRDRILRVHGVPCGEPAYGPRAVLVVQDVTEHDRYDQLRREFVANVSHELKSPLTSIRSLTEALMDGALDDPEANLRFVTLIEQDAVRLGRLIDDLLVLSRIESRALPIRTLPVTLRGIVEEVAASLDPSIVERRLQVHHTVADDLVVSADPDRLRQVLLNLVENAVKYNREGGEVLVTARRVDGQTEISVRDTGIGIPHDDLPRIFERFYRVDKTRSRELGGTGLGLSIVKHIVESHGGRIHVESQHGKGSVFTFTLPD